MFAALQNKLDQINIMTYDLSGPYGGWVTWFNSPIYDGGYRFPSTGGLVPSVEGAVNNFLGSGVAAGRFRPGRACCRGVSRSAPRIQGRGHGPGDYGRFFLGLPGHAR